MQSLEQLFVKEFDQMSMQRAAMTGTFTLDALAVPKFTKGIDKKRRVLIRGINDEYYGKLNGENALYWARPNLKRRKFGAGGAFLKDKSGNILTEEVSLTQGCIAVVSKVRLGVPFKYTPKDTRLQYVDCVCRNQEKNYIYIIPKENCYALNQCALVISLNRLKNFYAGYSVMLQSGHRVYIYVVAYNPLRVSHSYRVLVTKTSCNFKEEFSQLIQFWIANNMAYSFEDTALVESVRGRNNVAYAEYSTNLSEFVCYDPSKSLADNTDELTSSELL